jgi:predicted nucleic acid-binding protein
VPGYFFDTSVLAKLYHAEAGSQKAEALAEAPDTRLIVSQLSLVEIQSVFATKVISPPAGSKSLVSRRCFRSAERLICLHAVSNALRTVDALQLAVALELHRRDIVSAIVASDRNLGEVAALEGLPVINPIQTP